MDFYRRSLELKDETVAHRRFLHKNAETGTDLPVSCNYIWEKLQEYGFAPQKCGCGITAATGMGKPVILLRADMDALPMTEQSGEEFSPTHGKAAHTCGHDMHAAMLLCAAKMLKENEKQLKGTVKFMFQPGEETLTGCADMIENGILQKPTPDAAFALHTAAGKIPLGHFMYNAGGVMMSSSDYFTMTVTGKGGHGAYPHLAVDPINTAVQIYTAFNSIIAKESDPEKTCLLTVGRLSAGSAGNIIPDSAVMEGALRTDSPEMRAKLRRRMEQTSLGIAEAFDCGAHLQWTAGAPALVCEKDFTADMVNFAMQLDIPALAPVPDMKANASEDFANIAQKIPSAMFYISAGFDDHRGDFTAHNPKVRFNEDCLVQGAAIYAHCAAQWLADNG